MLENGSQSLSDTYCKTDHFLEDAKCCAVSRERTRCCHCAQPRRASPLTCLSVCFLLLTYNLLGGFLFLAIEGSSAPDTAVAASKPDLAPAAGLRARTVERLWAITEDLNILYKENWTELASKELMDFQRVLVSSLRGEEVESRGSRDPDDDYRWTFSSSFLYALTLITTIGHGNVAPKSALGKLAAMLYACVGIPIVMLYLATAGAGLARLVRRAYSRLRPPPRPRPAPGPAGTTPFQAALNPNPAPAPGGQPARVPAALGAILGTLYISLGALVFSLTERWAPLDGAYFSFSSLATIGFGRLRPGRRPGPAGDAALAVCCLYILIGIAVVAMCFDLIQESLRGGSVRAAAS